MLGEDKNYKVPMEMLMEVMELRFVFECIFIVVSV